MAAIKHTKRRVLTIMQLANRPLTVREMTPALLTDEKLEKTLQGSINKVLHDLEADGKVRKVGDVFLKSGTWAAQWEAIR